MTSRESQVLTSALPHLRAVRSASAESDSRSASDFESAARPTVGLHFVEREGVVSGAPESVWHELVEYAEATATALVGEGDTAHGARQRTLARMIVVERSRLALLQARTSLLIEQDRFGDLLRLEKIITQSSRRLVRLLDAHRRECRDAGPRSVTLVHAAGDVRLP